MSTFIFSLIPEIIDYPFLMILICCVFICFFGGFVFSSIYNLIVGFFNNE